MAVAVAVAVSVILEPANKIYIEDSIKVNFVLPMLSDNAMKSYARLICVLFIVLLVRR